MLTIGGNKILFFPQKNFSFLAVLCEEIICKREISVDATGHKGVEFLVFVFQTHF